MKRGHRETYNIKQGYTHKHIYVFIYTFTNKPIWSELDEFQRQKLKETQLTDDDNICKYLHLVIMMCCISPVISCATALYGTEHKYIYIFCCLAYRNGTLVSIFLNSKYSFAATEKNNFMEQCRTLLVNLTVELFFIDIL